MHLALFSYNYHPEPTGIPYYNTAMCRHWAACGWRVSVHTGVPHYPWWRVPDDYAGRDFRRGRGDEIIDGVTVHRVAHYVPRPPVSALRRMRLDASWLLAWWRRSCALRRRPDVLVLVAPPFLVGFLGLWLRWRLGVPVLYHVQDLQVDAAVGLGMLPRWIARTLAWLERVQLERVDVVSACSWGMARRLQARARTRRPVHLFPNWADTATMTPCSGANAYRRAWDLDADTVVCMYAGNLGRKQGLEFLIGAFAELVDDTNGYLVVAGRGAADGECQALLDRLPAGHWRREDLQPAARLREFLGAGDIHCIPQRRAVADLVMPSKLLNIMAVGRPVVVAAEDGTQLAETVRRAGCGVVVPPEDPAAFAAALRRLIADPALRERMGAAGRAHVVAELDTKAVLGRVGRGLCALAAAARRGCPAATRLF